MVKLDKRGHPCAWISTYACRNSEGQFIPNALPKREMQHAYHLGRIGTVELARKRKLMAARQQKNRRVARLAPVANAASRKRLARARMRTRSRMRTSVRAVAIPVAAPVAAEVYPKAVYPNSVSSGKMEAPAVVVVEPRRSDRIRARSGHGISRRRHSRMRRRRARGLRAGRVMMLMR